MRAHQILVSLLATLVLGATAHAQGANATAIAAIREYYTVLASSSDDLSSVEAKLKPVMKKIRGKLGPGIIRQLDRGFKRKYKKGLEFYRSLSACLAAGGARGISTLYRRYKIETRRTDVRLVIVKALADCGDKRALSTIMKTVHDKNDEVAAAAIEGCANYNKCSIKWRKNIAMILVEIYTKAESRAAGKGRTTKERVRFDRLKGPLQKALTAFCNGESFSNAAAWSAWLRENVTKPWK